MTLNGNGNDNNDNDQPQPDGILTKRNIFLHLLSFIFLYCIDSSKPIAANEMTAWWKILLASVIWHICSRIATYSMACEPTNMAYHASTDRNVASGPAVWWLLRAVAHGPTLWGPGGSVWQTPPWKWSDDVLCDLPPTWYPNRPIGLPFLCAQTWHVDGRWWPKSGRPRPTPYDPEGLAYVCQPTPGWPIMAPTISPTICAYRIYERKPWPDDSMAYSINDGYSGGGMKKKHSGNDGGVKAGIDGINK